MIFYMLLKKDLMCATFLFIDSIDNIIDNIDNNIDNISSTRF